MFTLVLVVVSMLFLVMQVELMNNPICAFCGKRLQHADDCPERKE